MARKYSKAASKKVEKAMDERKKGTLKSGRSGKKVTSRKQAIAIGLSEARAEGKKVPKKKTAKKEDRQEKENVLRPPCATHTSRYGMRAWTGTGSRRPLSRPRQMPLPLG